MFGLSYNSYKHQRDQELLDTLRHAIFVLKLAAQDRLHTNAFDEQDVTDKRNELITFLAHLATLVSSLEQGVLDEGIDLSFMGLAHRFIQINPRDVSDRVDELRRLRTKLEQQAPLVERDFYLLDRVQTHLEEEVSQGIQGLFRL